MKEVKQFFKPEFVNRIDEIIVFHALNDSVLKQIAHKFIKELQERLMQKDIQLFVDDEVYDEIAEQGVDPIYGARPMKRYIQRTIENVIAHKMIEGNAGKGDRISLRCHNGEYEALILHDVE